MKYFYCIFVFYFWALSIMPCSDVHDLNISVSTESANISTQEHSNCPHEKGKDDCSPFCICSCCGHNFLGIKFPQFSIQLPVIFNVTGKYSRYSKDWNNEYFHSIFHPPQV